MHLVETVAVFVAGILPRAVADALVIVAPLGQSEVDVVLVGQHLGARRDARLDQRSNRNLADVLQHVDDHLAAALDHAEDRWLLLLKRAATRGALEAVSPALTAFFFTAEGCPL